MHSWTARLSEYFVEHKVALSHLSGPLSGLKELINYLLPLLDTDFILFSMKNT